MTAEAMAKMCSQKRLIRAELTTLIGLMLREPIDWSIPTPEVVSRYIEQSEALLEELHEALLPDPNTLLAEASENPAANPFASAAVLREAIFYAGESAYPSQYRDLAPRKYAADSQWLRANKQIDLSIAETVCRSLPDILAERLTSVTRGLEGAPPGRWTLLPAFTFSSAQVVAHTGLTASRVQAFLDAFTLPPNERNAAFASLSSFNAACAYPFIRTRSDEYVLLQYQGLLEAIYESPLLLDARG